jgi:hypothetical protein
MLNNHLCCTAPQALCTDGYKGIFIVWICLFVTSGCLYFTMCFARSAIEDGSKKKIPSL